MERPCIRSAAHSSTEVWLFVLDKHVDASHVAKLHAERLGRGRDTFQIFTPDGDVDVLREASGIRFRFFNVQIHSELAKDSVLDSGRREHRLHQFRQIEDLLHAFLKEPIDNNHIETK